MEIKIATDLSSEPVSTDEIKQFIKFAYDSDADEVSLLANLNKSVRTYLERVTGVAFGEKSYVVRFDYEDGEAIHFDSVTMKPTALAFRLPVFPVYEVTEVRSINLDGDESEIDYQEKGNYERLVVADLDRTSQLRVKFTAGYGDDTESLPEDVKEAIRKQVGRWYWNRDDYVEGKYLPDIENLIRTHRRHLI